MSKQTYSESARRVDAGDKPLVWLHGEVKTPPFGHSARVETGFLLRLLQRGEKLSTPPEVIATCQERLKRYDDAQAKAQGP